MVQSRERAACGLLAILLVFAGCTPQGEIGSNAGDEGNGSSVESRPAAPTEQRGMRLPSELEPTHPAPPPASQAPVAPSLAAKPGTAESKQVGLNLANDLSEIFHDAATRVIPAVVTIRTISHGEEDDDRGSNPLRQFFGDDQSDEVRESLGSGVIIDAAGVILTNYHVVREAAENTGEAAVQLHDGRQFRIAAVKGDRLTDLAVIKLKDAVGLPVAQLGDSDALKVGDWVLAVGNPFGLEATVTAGIISAKGRGLGVSPREDFLQTDTPINPGNSGGPLVNLRGNVIGINTAISSTTGGYQGIGFTIPSNMAKWVGRQLIENGNVRWAYLGIGVRTLTPQLAARYGVHDLAGLLVVDVRRNSPAAKAGVHSHDVITKFDDTPVSDPHQLQSLADMSEIGSQHTLHLLRDGKSTPIRVTIAEQPTERSPRSQASAWIVPQL
jgi:serine protease Do